jgi:hypothetical protein
VKTGSGPLERSIPPCFKIGVGSAGAEANPDGTLLCFQPYGQAGLLVADLDLGEATGLLASRCRTSPL